MNIYGVHLVLQIPPPFSSSWLQFLRAVSDYVLLVVYGNAVIECDCKYQPGSTSTGRDK
jgi:hypothetical protein